MKIITHLASVHNRTDNRVFFKQCVDLASNNFAVNLVVADGKGDDYRQGVKITDFSVFKYGKSRFIRFMITSPIVILKSLRLKTDLYHIHDPELLFYYFIFSPFFKTRKCIYDMHENLGEQVKSKSWIPHALKIPFAFVIKKIEKVILSNIPVIFAENSYVKSFPFIKNYEVVLNFPKSIWLKENSKTKADKDDPIIGYLGNISSDRGIDILLHSVVNTNKKGLRLRLELIGNIPDEIYKMQEYIYLKDRELIYCHGFVANDMAIKVVQKWNIGFSVLRSYPNYMESYPTKLFEYFASGIPVITSNFPLYTNLVNSVQGGICIEPNSVTELTHAIKKILNEPDRYSPKFNFEEHGWPSQLEKLINFYESII